MRSACRIRQWKPPRQSDPHLRVARGAAGASENDVTLCVLALPANWKKGRPKDSWSRGGSTMPRHTARPLAAQRPAVAVGPIPQFCFTTAVLCARQRVCVGVQVPTSVDRLALRSVRHAFRKWLAGLQQVGGPCRVPRATRPSRHHTTVPQCAEGEDGGACRRVPPASLIGALELRLRPRWRGRGSGRRCRLG